MVWRFIERDPDVKMWLGVLLLPFFCGASIAQTASYPDRPITLIVTAAAGGVTDVAARAVGQELSKAWGQPVIVENRGGAAHILGAQSVAKADPDGYTLMVGEAGTFTINPTVYPPGKLPYDTDRDFVPISGLVRINQALIADNNLPAANAAELIALAKQKPGQLTYGTAGIGSAPHMNMALFESMAGVKLQAVHYRGAAPALNDLAGGSINLMSVSVSLALPAFRGGRVKMLGIGSDKRIALASDIPTVAESGLPGYQAVTWFGLFGPAKLPPDIVGKLNAAVNDVVHEAEFNRHFSALGYEMTGGSVEEFASFLDRDIERYAKLMKSLGNPID